MSFQEWIEDLADYVEKRYPEKIQKKSSKGRPSGYSRSRVMELCYQWLHYGILTLAARDCSLSMSTVWRWRHRYFLCRMLMEFTQAIVAQEARMHSAYARSIQLYRRIMKSKRRAFFAPNGKKRRPGRPCMYWEKEALSVGSSWSETARLLGVSRRTVGYWSKKFLPFWRRLGIAWALKKLGRRKKEVDRLEHSFYKKEDKSTKTQARFWGYSMKGKMCSDSKVAEGGIGTETGRKVYP